MKERSPTENGQQASQAGLGDWEDERNLDAKQREHPSTTELITQLGRTLHECAMPAHELEERMNTVSSVLGTPASFFSTPTSLFISFEEPSETRMVRVTPPSIDLARLSRVHQLQLAIESKHLPQEEIWRELSAIEQAKTYGTCIDVFALGLIAATATVLFGGGGYEVAVAGGIGMLIALVGMACSARARIRYLNEMLSGFSATVLASFAAWFLPQVSIEITTLSSLIVLIPGLAVTVGINELATQNLASGSARLAGAFATFLTIAFGIVMGRNVVGVFLTLPKPQLAEPFSFWWVLVSLVLTSLAIGVIFRAGVRDMLWILLAGVLAFYGTRLGGLLFTSEAAPWTGAFTLGCASNVFARRLKRPAAVMLVPGLLLLVSGSLGFFGLQALLDHDVNTAIEAVFAMSLIAASIAAGLLMANVLVSPLPRVGQQASPSSGG